MPRPSFQIAACAALSALVVVRFASAAQAKQDNPPAPPKDPPSEVAPHGADPKQDSDSKQPAAGSAKFNWNPPGLPMMKFVDVTKPSGIDYVNLSGEPMKPRLIDTLGAGVCWFDYDGDGLLDLFVPNGSTLDAILGKKKNDVSDHLYRNKGDGTFEDVTDKAGLRDDRWSLSAVAGDFDNDGDEDLFVCNFGPCFLYRNNGDGTFTDIAASAGVQFDSVTPGAAWGDIDGDGDLDLYVAAYIVFDKKHPWPPFAKTMRNMKVMNGPIGLKGAPDKLFRNDGNGKFTDITKEAGLRTTEEEHGFTVQLLDLNGDNLLDIFVANDMTPNHHYKQLAPGKFTPCGSESGLDLNHDGVKVANMGVAIADLNDDLIPDIFTTDFAAQPDALWVSQGDNVWEEDPSPVNNARSNMPYVGWGTGFYDFDLDGDEDLIEFNGHVFPQVDTERPREIGYAQWPMMYRRDGPIRFTEIGKEIGDDFYVERNVRGVGFADYDEDGDVDMAVLQIDGPLLLLRNDTERKYHFLRVQLEGTRINRDAYGSRVIVEAGGRRQTRWVLGQGSFISQNDPRAFYGLGTLDKVDKITVRWTGGKETVIDGPIDVDRTIVVKEDVGKVAELLPKQVRTRAEANAAQAKALAAPAGGSGTSSH